MKTALEVFQYLDCTNFGIISPSYHVLPNSTRRQYIKWINDNIQSWQKYSWDESTSYYWLEKHTESRIISWKFRRHDYENNDRKIITLEQWLEIVNDETNNGIYLTTEQAKALALGHGAHNSIYLF